MLAYIPAPWILWDMQLQLATALMQPHWLCKKWFKHRPNHGGTVDHHWRLRPSVEPVGVSCIAVILGRRWSRTAHRSVITWDIGEGPEGPPVRFDLPLDPCFVIIYRVTAEGSTNEVALKLWNENRLVFQPGPWKALSWCPVKDDVSQ